MKQARIPATLFLLCLALLASAWARTTKTLPATVVLRDNYDGFVATLVSARHGKFDVSLGESHEGDPGFEGNEKGADFQYGIVIYHLEPDHKPLPYAPMTVPVANGKQGMSVRPLFRGTKTVSFKGVTFSITPKKLTDNYGAGQSAIEVRAVEQ